MIKNLLKLIFITAAIFCFVLLLMAGLCGDTVATIILLIISVGGMIFNGLI